VKSIADLPVQQAAKLIFVFNLQTRQGAWLSVPSKLVAIADEVIE
jgi:hypothetical protein